MRVLQQIFINNNLSTKQYLAKKQKKTLSIIISIPFLFYHLYRKIKFLSIFSLFNHDLFSIIFVRARSVPKAQK